MRDGAARELEGGIGGVVDVGVVGLVVLVPALRNVSDTEAGHALHLAKQVVEHVAPVAQHIEDDAAAIFLAVVPGRALRRLPVTLEHPIAELATDREDAAEETGIDQRLELEETRQKQLVLHHAVADAGLVRGAGHVEGIVQCLGDRLLAIDVLAGRDRLVQQLRPQLCRGGIEEQCIVLARERRIEIGGPARDTVRLRQLLELGLVAADQDRIGHHPVAVPQRDAALRADCHDRADQVLIHAHASGDAVHDDAETMLCHYASRSREALPFPRVCRSAWCIRRISRWSSSRACADAAARRGNCRPCAPGRR